MVRVLIVEDERVMASAVRDGLRLEAIAADLAHDGAAALEALSINDYDAVVLDRDIPRISGDEVARWITSHQPTTRIIMVTAADRLDDKATGFELGADDYLTKPFAMRELILRLRAIARRSATATPPVVEWRGLKIDPFRREVYRDGRYVALTRKQFAVLGGSCLRGRRRCQCGGAAGARVGRERRSVHQCGAHHDFCAAQAPGRARSD